MRKVAFCLLLSCFVDPKIALPESLSGTELTIVLDFDQPYSSVSLNAMKWELRRLMKTVGVTVDLQLKSDLKPHAVFNDLLVFEMKGACTMQSLPIGAVLDERGPLGMTHSSDGELMPFGQVNCDRVRRSIETVLGSDEPYRHQLQYGFALSMVIAHEMYHILTKSAGHTKNGLTKESLSAQELLNGGFGFSRDARAEMQESLRERGPIPENSRNP